MHLTKKSTWISDPLHDGMPLRPISLFQRDFMATAPGMAELHIAALGIFEIRLNNKIVTDEIFAPGWADYRFRTEMRTYSFSVEAGQNRMEILLAGGWFCGHIAGSELPAIPSVTAFLSYPGGTLATGADWLCASDGPWLYSDFYIGEFYDSRRNFSAFHPAQTMNPEVRIEEFTGSPIRRCKYLHPISVQGNIVDFGENISGREIITITAEPGARITLRHAEMLDEQGDLYTANLRKADSTNTFIARGGTQTYEPLFTCHGFRYLEVTGAAAFSVVAVVIGADFPFHSTFKSSNQLLNQLAENIQRSWRGNSLSAPTDCPQRDERAGWLGDAQVFIRAALYLSNSADFFRRWLRDVRLGCHADGNFPIVAPYLRRFERYGDAGWADAGIICPWTIYEFTHDPEVLAENLPAMLKFVRRRREESKDYIFAQARFGDWLNQNTDTPKPLLGTAFFARSADLTARAARVLGQNSEAREMQELFEKIRFAFECRFGGELTTQTALALALEFNLLSLPYRKEAAATLDYDVRVKRGGHLSTGFLGTPHILYALSNNGYASTAWALLEQKTVPSWLSQVVCGATTVWEHWDGWCQKRGFKDPSMNSFNHYAYGAVYDWMISYAAGISPDFNIVPHPGGTLKHLSVSYKGLEVSWEKNNNQYIYQVSVPDGITARFRGKPLKTGQYQFSEPEDASSENSFAAETMLVKNHILG